MAKKRKNCPFRAKADKEWRRIVKAGKRCEICGSSSKQLHAHHLIGKNNVAYRHIVENGICLCATHHSLGPDSAHKNSEFFLRWLQHGKPKQWRWYMNNTVPRENDYAGVETVNYHAIKRKHRGDEVEYNELREQL